jgi:hypothetical protein
VVNYRFQFEADVSAPVARCFAMGNSGKTVSSGVEGGAFYAQTNRDSNW